MFSVFISDCNPMLNLMYMSKGHFSYTDVYLFKPTEVPENILLGLQQSESHISVASLFQNFIADCYRL